MEEARMAEIWRELERLDLENMSAAELAMLHQKLQQWHIRLETLLGDVAWARAERWWQQMPEADARTIRLLLKNTRLTAPLLQQAPELNHLLLLANLADPDVVRLWANMTPDVRATRILELRKALALSEHRRTSTSREDRAESTLLAYDVLGLTPSATWAEIRKAYRDLATLHHPDRGGDPTLFHAVQKAYKLLEGRYL